MNQIYYSPSVGNFFSSSLHGNAIPDDKIKVSKDEYANLISERSIGKIVSVSGGAVVASDAIIEDPSEVQRRAKESLQSIRDLFLTRLAGIAFFSTDEGVTSKCKTLRKMILDITDDDRFTSSVTFENAKAALISRYIEICESATNDLKKVFREVEDLAG